MARLVTGRIVKFDATTGDPIGQPGLRVRARPAAFPVFVGDIEELSGLEREATTGADGSYTIALPDPDELDPSSAEYQIILPNCERWTGEVPTDAGPFTLLELRDDWGWTLTSSSSQVASPSIGFDRIRSGASAIAQRKTLRVDGTLLVAADDSVNGWTNITAPGLVPKTTTLTAGTGLSGGGDLSANRTISMPNVGPGAATYGGGGNVIASLTLDVQGRVTALTTAAAGGGGGVSDLQDAYAGSSTAVLTLTSGIGGLVLKDASTPIGAPLLGLQNNAGSITSYWEIQSGTTLRWRYGGAPLHILSDQPASGSGTAGKALFLFGGTGAAAGGSTPGASGGAVGVFAGAGGAGTASFAAGNGVALSLTGGDAGAANGGTGGNGGNVFVGAGAATGSGTNGVIRFAIAAVDKYKITGDVFEAQSIPFGMRSTVADGGTAVAAYVDTSTAWSNASAKLLSLRSNAVEKAYFKADGSLALATGATFAAGSNTLVSGDKLQAAQLSIASQAAGDLLYASSTTAWARLAKATDGQILTLVSGLPAWADAAGGSSSFGGDATTPGFPTASNADTGFFDSGSDTIGIALAGIEGFRFVRISSSEAGIQPMSGGYLYCQSPNGLNYSRWANGETLIVGGNGVAGIRLDSNGNTVTSDLRATSSGSGSLGTSGHEWLELRLTQAIYQLGMTAPSAPASGGVLYWKNAGGGKVSLCAQAPTGGEHVIYAEP